MEDVPVSYINSELREILKPKALVYIVYTGFCNSMGNGIPSPFNMNKTDKIKIRCQDNNTTNKLS